MGWYFKKSKNYGPFRLNLSKSGLGVSTGIKGARISVGPSGTYISGGRNGLYYRQKISDNNRHLQRQYRMNRIAKENEDVKDFKAISSIEELSKDINKTHRIYKIWLVSLIVSIVGAIIYVNFYLFLLFLLLIVIYFIFKNKMVFNIDYDLDESSNSKWQSFLKEMESIFDSKKTWIISNSSSNYWKTNAGTSRGVKRKDVRSARIIKKGKKNKSRTKFNDDIFQIVANKYTFIFTPSMIIIIKNGKVECFTYNDINLYVNSCYFVEDSKFAVPRDATIIDYRWQYINKNGTRDLRYRTNKQLPRCEYGVLKLDASTGESIEIEFSDCSKVDSARRNIREYVDYIKYLPIIDHERTENINLEIEPTKEEKKVEFSDETKELINKQTNPLIQDIYDNMEIDDKDE